ncbi:ABC transporter ATP-binding protein [Eremococcus coleocola]|uniref:ABC transporter, ATP-binding protein n=1 Tax=Eremococcus coleocola ACS-139-V-Col8 TaxID=908337 RepID=E4KP05_9LACT|nr:ABC transporter ATP-binding protein [Eremococcus coleocola]EFR31253.1 ABC transporter, ATP-binding protein [Eremococcus coleocola ACS-139-V-Col8]
MLKDLWAYMRSKPITYGLATLFAMLSNLIGMVPNRVVETFVDTVVANQLSNQRLMTLMLTFLLAIVTLYLVDLSWVILILGNAYTYVKDLRHHFFKRLLGFRAPFYERFRSGDLITRLSSDMDMVGDFLGYGFMMVVGDCFRCVAVFVVMLLLYPAKLVLISLSPFILFSVIMYYVSQTFDRLYDQKRDAVVALNQEVLESVEGVRVMRAFGQSETLQTNFANRTQDVVAQADRLNPYFATFGSVPNIFGGLSLAISLTYGGYLLGQGQVTLGQLVAVQMYLGMFHMSIWGLSEIIVMYRQAMISYGKLTTLQTEKGEPDQEGNLPISQIEQIEFRDYSFTYPGAKLKSLDHISFKISKGQTLGLVGKTGAGKSSLIRQLLRQYPLSHQGEILINGQSIENFDLSQYESLVAYVPQEHILFSKSVADNIYFSNPQADESSLDQAIIAADFKKDIVNLNQGLDTMIGEKGVAISGGQKQRVSLARAFLAQGDLLILDDSLSAVDAKTESQIIDNLKAQAQDQIKIIVSHRLSAVEEADLILVLDQGKIIQQGSHQELISQDGWYQAQARRQGYLKEVSPYETR